MKKNILFVIGAIAGLFLLGLLFGGSGFSSRGMMGGSMMGGWGYSPFGWTGMIFMWLIPIGFIVITVLGIVWLVQNVSGGKIIANPVTACPSCIKSVQPEWKNCAYCGATLG
jgi:hypothetical protein